MSITLTVFFDGQFWVALFEQSDGSMLRAARIVLGAEPKHEQIETLVLHDYDRLRFSPSIGAAAFRPLANNPKRRQRQIARAQKPGIGTKAQREADAQQQFALHLAKKKAKHRGH